MEIRMLLFQMQEKLRELTKKPYLFPAKTKPVPYNNICLQVRLNGFMGTVGFIFFQSQTSRNCKGKMLCGPIHQPV